MSLPRLRGHREARALLVRAAAADDLPHSLLLHGAPGIGKERVGLWVAQLLLCERPAAPDGPCDTCLPCRLALRLEHPDLHWFFPLPRPDASSPEKLREKLEDERAAELQARREDPHHVPSFDRPPAHFLAAVQTLQKLAGARPAMGRRKVLVVGDAELMVPQESSPEAANAFLKVLEEPPADTWIVLTSSQPGALLPTVRSRLLPLRLGPVPDDEVIDYLTGEAALSPAEAARVAALANGAIGKAIRLLPTREGEGALAARREAGRGMLLAALSGSAVPGLAAAHERAPAGARGDFVGQLEAFAEWLRDLLALASGAGEAVRDPETRALLQRAVSQHAISPAGVGRALEHVARARDLALGNVNPQLLTADTLRGVRAELRPDAVRRRGSALR